MHINLGVGVLYVGTWVFVCVWVFVYLSGPTPTLTHAWSCHCYLDIHTHTRTHPGCPVGGVIGGLLTSVFFSSSQVLIAPGDYKDPYPRSLVCRSPVCTDLLFGCLEFLLSLFLRCGN